MSNSLEKLDLSLVVSVKEKFIDGNDLKFNILDHFRQNGFSQCHIYSCPYKLNYYSNLTNRFRGGFFPCVDEQLFEHAFFLRIAQSFPFLEILTVINRKRQNERRLPNTKD